MVLRWLFTFPFVEFQLINIACKDKKIEAFEIWKRGWLLKCAKNVPKLPWLQPGQNCTLFDFSRIKYLWKGTFLDRYQTFWENSFLKFMLKLTKIDIDPATSETAFNFISDISKVGINLAKSYGWIPKFSK